MVSEGGLERGHPMKPTITYRKRRDLALKKFSAPAIVSVLAEALRSSGIVLAATLGRPCEVKKEKLIGYLLFAKLCGDVYEQMELNSELYLQRHYDHSAFQYHYTALSCNVILQLTSLLEQRIKHLTNEILLHIFDSTALSTSVREERIRQGTRNKEKLTNKFHTMLGYDPPFQIVIVEGMLASDNHTSDAEGAENILKSKEGIKGYSFGDAAFETYGFIDESLDKNLEPIYKPTKKAVGKKLSAKAKLREVWNGNHSRIYKEIRGTGEVLYGAATRCGLIHTNSIREDNRQKDSLLIGLRQNLFTYLRLEAFVELFENLYLV